VTDILTVLKKEHQEVSDLLDEALTCDGDDPKFAKLAQQIESALTIHAKLEEKLFYPRLLELAEPGEDKTDVFVAYTEHDVLKHLIALLKSEKRRDEAFKAELQVLGEDVKRHVKEEESTIFGLARKELSKERLEEIGEEFAAAKKQAVAA
jgi:hemerythrin-like domain-containing protein